MNKNGYFSKISDINYNEQGKTFVDPGKQMDSAMRKRKNNLLKTAS